MSLHARDLAPVAALAETDAEHLHAGHISTTTLISRAMGARAGPRPAVHLTSYMPFGWDDSSRRIRGHMAASRTSNSRSGNGKITRDRLIKSLFIGTA